MNYQKNKNVKNKNYELAFDILNKNETLNREISG